MLQVALSPVLSPRWTCATASSLVQHPSAVAPGLPQAELNSLACLAWGCRQRLCMLPPLPLGASSRRAPMAHLVPPGQPGSHCSLAGSWDGSGYCHSAEHCVLSTNPQLHAGLVLILEMSYFFPFQLEYRHAF